MARKSPAQQAFDQGLADLLKPTITRLHPESTELLLTIPAEPLDTKAVAELFEEYGMYLRLVGGRAPIGESRVFEWTAPSVA